MTSSNSSNNSQRTFARSKFVFTDIEKFILMDVNLNVPLADLKYSFSKILNIDFFGKALKYTY